MRGRGKINHPLQNIKPRQAGSLRTGATTVNRLGAETVFNNCYQLTSFNTMREWLINDLDGRKDLAIAWIKAPRYDALIK